MRVVRIPREDRKYDWRFFQNFIKTNKCDFNFDIIDILSIPNLENLRLSLYIIYSISRSNSIIPPIHPTPKDGIELKNKSNYTGFGIYHAHLNDSNVLIWYLTWSNKGYIIKFRYIEHPPLSDDYRSIIQEIYKDSIGFNISIGEYFTDLESLLKDIS